MQFCLVWYTNPRMDKNNIDRTELSRLYPTAKNADQIKLAEDQMQERQRQRLVKFPRLKVAIYAALVFLGLVLLVTRMQTAFVFEDQMSGLANISTLLLIGLLTALLIYLYSVFIYKVFYTYGQSLKVFGFIYTVFSIAFLGVLFNSGVMQQFTYWVPLSTAAYGVGAYLVMLASFRMPKA